MEKILQHQKALEDNLEGTALKVGLILSDRIDKRGKDRKFKNTESMMRWLWRQGQSEGVKQSVMYSTTADLVTRGFFTIEYKGESLSLSRALPGVEA